MIARRLSRRAAVVWIACASACSAPAPTVAVARPEHGAVEAAPSDAPPAHPVDGAAPLLASCTRSPIEGRAIGGVDILCGGYTLSDMWTLRGPRCDHECIAKDIARSVRGEGGTATIEPFVLEAMPAGTVVAIEEKGLTGWFVLVSPRPDRTVTCRRPDIAQSDRAAHVATVARCKAMLQEWLAVDRPDRELCDRVAAHVVALSGPGPGDARVRDAVMNGCLGSTRAWAECTLAKATIESEEACNPLSDPSASGASRP